MIDIEPSTVEPVPDSGTIQPKAGTDAPEYLTDRDPGDEQPTGRCMCRKCGEPLRPTEVWFRVQRGVAPERIGLCTRCAMAKIPGRVSL